MPEAGTSAGKAAAVPPPAPPLDDVMLAMDVVDTLRHRQRLVESELDSGERDEALFENLKSIYASQGITVTDEVLRQGVAALKEGRFVYEAPARGTARWAHLYVNRAKWGRLLLAVAVVVAVVLAGYDAAFRAPHRALVADLGRVHAEVLARSLDPEASARADTLYSLAGTAAARGDDKEARATLATLKDLEEQLLAAYTLRIAADTTGVWRVPDLNEGAANYYIIVEPVDQNGRSVAVPVTSEETGETSKVRAFGLRVSEETFDAIRRDKLDDGIIQQDVFGEKQAGFLQPVYRFETTGAAITSWD